MKQDIIYEENDGYEFEKQLKKFKQKLARCRQEKEEYLAGWQRTQADFINYKKRQEEKIVEIYQESNARLVRELLNFIDSLEAARVNSKASQDNNGLLTLKEQLQDILRKYGLEEIKTLGEKFNPELHEVMEMVKSSKKEGLILEEIQKGYLLNNKLLRPAKVKIAVSA